MPPLLPQTVRDMADILGWPATEAFVRAFGGKRIHIPKTTETPMALAIAEAIGREETMKLIEWAGDTTINVPFCRALIRQVRNIEICETYASGKGLNELVGQYKISHRQLQYILAKTDTSIKPVSAQLGLGF